LNIASGILQQANKIFLLFFIAMLSLYGVESNWSSVDVAEEKEQGIKQISIDFAPPAKTQNSTIKRENTTKATHENRKKTKHKKASRKKIKHKSKNNQTRKVRHKAKTKKQKTQKKKLPSHYVAKQPSEEELNLFADRVRAKIKSNAGTKPQMAIRRGISGTVIVGFVINKNGMVSNVVLDGASVFKNSARRALQKSVPFDTSGVEPMMPREYSVAITYQ